MWWVVLWYFFYEKAFLITQDVRQRSTNVFAEPTVHLHCGVLQKANRQSWEVSPKVILIWPVSYQLHGHRQRPVTQCLLLQWLIWFLKLNISSPVVPGYGPLLDELLQVCQSTIGINILHHHGLWLERDCATTLYVHMMTCLRGYAVLGRRAMTLHVRAFIQKPKHHALHHIAFALKRQLKTSASLILSPQAFSNDVNEDYVGRISRLSRRVSIRLCDLRVCQRLFLKIAALLRQRRGTGAKCGLTKPKHKHVGISGNRVYRRNLKFKRGWWVPIRTGYLENLASQEKWF